MSEDVEGFSNLQKYIPNYYLKFAHPVLGIEKIVISDILLVEVR